jgi:hypothetical protein
MDIKRIYRGILRFFRGDYLNLSLIKKLNQKGIGVY